MSLLIPVVFFLPSREGGGSEQAAPARCRLRLAPLRHLKVRRARPDLRPGALAPGAARAGSGGERAAQAGTRTARAPAPPAGAQGLSPLTRRKRCPYMGLFCSVTPARSPGRFRESPPPLCRAGPRRREGGRDFPGQSALWARKAPGPGPGRPRREGRALLGPGSHPSGFQPAGAGAAPRPRPLRGIRPRRGVTAADAVGAAPARKGGARLPGSPSLVPGQKPATARSGPVRAVVWAAGCRHSPLPSG